MTRRTTQLRWLIPAGVAAVALAGSVVVPAMSASAEPALPKVSAQTLLSRAMSTHVQNFSGTVRSTPDLGLPALPDQGSSGQLPAVLTSKTTLRVAKAGEKRQRVAVMGSTSEKNVVHNGRNVWIYDSAKRKAVHTRLPAATQGQAKRPQVTPNLIAKHALRSLAKGTDISVGRAAKVAGRPAYQLVLHPKSAKSLIGSVSTYVDAKTWMPLGFEVLPRGSADPAINVRFTKLSYAKPAASTFEFTPPAGTKVKQHAVTPRHHGLHPDHGKMSKHGWGSFSWTKVVKVADMSQSPGKRPGFANQLRAAGTRVSGDFGSGTLVRTRLLTVLIVDNGPVYAGAVTPHTVEAAASHH